MGHGFSNNIPVALALITLACDTSETPLTEPPRAHEGTRGTAAAARLSFTTINSNYDHTCGVAVGAVAYCWGGNGAGQLGDGTTRLATKPVPVSGALTFETIDAGFLHSCGLTTDGAAYCWGSNIWGQLGNGTVGGQILVPQPVAGRQMFTELHAGGSHACALATSGAAYCWGFNLNAQLGRPTTGDYGPVPEPVVGGFTFTALTVGQSHSCGHASDGQWYCWGSDEYGQFGRGTQGDESLVPLPVKGGRNFVNVWAEGYRTCGVTALGKAYCWGANDLGQLGTGKINGPELCVGIVPCSTLPVPVVGGLTFVRLGMGFAHTCGITTPGETYCWGSNQSAELGHGTSVGPRSCDSLPCSPEPLTVLGGVAFVSLTGGYKTTCALTSTQAAYCWGRNDLSLLGVGSSSSVVATPLPVVAP